MKNRHLGVGILPSKKVFGWSNNWWLGSFEHGNSASIPSLCPLPVCLANLQCDHGRTNFIARTVRDWIHTTVVSKIVILTRPSHLCDQSWRVKANPCVQHIQSTTVARLRPSLHGIVRHHKANPHLNLGHQRAKLIIWWEYACFSYLLSILSFLFLDLAVYGIS